MAGKIKLDAIVTVDRMREFKENLRFLGEQSLLIGVPAAKTERNDQDQMNNATLAYIHDNGSPAANIPQREFLRPGVRLVKQRLADMFKRAGLKALEGDKTAVEDILNAAGLVAVSAVKRKITEGPFVPLQPSTIKAKGGKERPLIDTGQLRNSITYVIRKVRGK